MNIKEDKKKFSILIMEDNVADIIIKEIFKESSTKTNIHVAYNGIEASKH
ncbi:MAG: hypothetical protein ABFC34_06565 [Methanobacterium sp.]